jgi:hypothetical protein
MEVKYTSYQFYVPTADVPFDDCPVLQQNQCWVVPWGIRLPNLWKFICIDVDSFEGQFCRGQLLCVLMAVLSPSYSQD